MYLSVACPDCKERAYWALLTLGQSDGHFVETAAVANPLALSADQLKRKADEVGKQKGEPIQFRVAR